jgi:tripartite-type tricarboxylate transporter receptor subunit TctC
LFLQMAGIQMTHAPYRGAAPVDAWQGVFAPAKTPPAIVQKISGDLAKALVDRVLVEKART